jgi:hypothetical protein
MRPTRRVVALRGEIDHAPRLERRKGGDYPFYIMVHVELT